MRVIECNHCGEAISAASNDELVTRLGAHLNEEHDEASDSRSSSKPRRTRRRTPRRL
jgi:predicted small metal-binding protein